MTEFQITYLCKRKAAHFKNFYCTVYKYSHFTVQGQHENMPYSCSLNFCIFKVMK